jgi:SlyX protein
MPNSPSDRLDTLEVRIAFQDEAIDTLNKSVTDQWAIIEALKREIARLADRLQDAESRGAGRNEPEPPPPHY